MPLKKIADYSLSYLQVLDPSGIVDKSLEPDLTKDQLLKLYRAMCFAREGDKRMLALQRQGRIGTFAPTTGQEASVCGATLAMTEKDWFVGAFREMPGHMMRGETFCQYLLFHNGFEEGSIMPGKENRTLPIQIIVGAQTLHAVGLAYAAKYRKEKNVAAVCFFGDGATSEGDFHEALNFASVWQVPCVFICQNNHWAISVPLAKQMRSKTIAQKAIAYDMPTLQVDANDALPCTAPRVKRLTAHTPAGDRASSKPSPIA